MSEFLMDKTESLLRIGQWLQRCEETHPGCAISLPATFPSRLLDVQAPDGQDNCAIRLVETSGHPPDRYICLSHRWGPETEKTRCTTGNISCLKQNILFDNLPSSFRRAIELTREIGIRYLWIDSLCIIQDGDNGKDWEIESSKMADIYQGAYLTILMAWTGDQDLSAMCESRVSDSSICVNNGSGKSYPIGVRSNGKRDTENWKDSKLVRSKYPLLTRGWICQERLLSPRLLVCEKEEFEYHCLEGRVCECGSPSLAPHPPPMAYQMSFLGSISGPRQYLVGRNQKDHVRPGHQWRQIVALYMALELTKQEDILSAIAGCAKAIWRFSKDGYFAGLWQSTFCRDLMWFNRGRYEQVLARPTQWTAPSWSWASIQIGQEIEFYSYNLALGPVEEFITKPMIKELWCEKSGADSFGRLKSGCFQLEVQLFPCEVRRFCVSIGRSKRQMVDLHHVRRMHQRAKRLCLPTHSGLDLNGALVNFYRDIPLANELDFLGFSLDCSVCGLAPVFLLRVAQHSQVINKKALKNFFLVLKQVDEHRLIYERIGALDLSWEDFGTGTSWFEEVWTPNLLPPQRITIL